ncbi:putative nucleic acid-binding protein [Xenococcus sp. PCC 7305]|uniref:type II toxin-antitoxin system VapC family toxin n=1 Tax=Xenococcus sp. PCC 7305 TaxID=102125 RepID=UPI0002AC8E53|nr:PIN domain-containing protein [Xenococcus sp. PCC 7305]ELS03532.1 putative nucleic acid-binding protein [Xenococcus sp. PCC 7305]
MSKLFIDTSGWASLFIPTETYHQQAAKYFRQAQQTKQRLITTNYVVTELVALLGSRQKTSRPKLFQYIDSIKLALCIDLIHVNDETDAIAWELCKSRPDKAWSLVDCSSFVVMQQLEIQKALTTDKHFEQAGFIRLLK